MVQLTEWVYKVILANQSASQTTRDDIISTYTKCLSWHREVFELLDRGGSRTPSAIFIQTLVGREVAGLELHPHEMCAQAVQSILSLAQSYDDLFTLRRVPAFVPYFVCACGLFSLAVEDSGPHMNFIQSRQREAANSEEAEAEETSNTHFLPMNTTAKFRITVSTVVQARLLLSRMASTHPAAAIAEKKLSGP
ncbi:hypothetical protein HC256_001410 [Beauveria bassiana]|nr:hypothetical protein HC256_001410 [Beauveria bassiana]